MKPQASGLTPTTATTAVGNVSPDIQALIQSVFGLTAINLESLLDEAVKAGATLIDGVSFVASESAIAVGQQQAIRAASEDAINQANAALNALNLKQQEVESYW